MSELIQLSFDKILQTRSYTVIVLASPAKRFAIYTDASIGRTLQLFLTEMETPRPLTHDLAGQIFNAIQLNVKQVVIYDVQDTVYFAKLFLEQQIGDIKHIIEIDARPSDSLIWALMNHAPVYCRPEVLEKTIAIED